MLLPRKREERITTPLCSLDVLLLTNLGDKFPSKVQFVITRLELIIKGFPWFLVNKEFSHQCALRVNCPWIVVGKTRVNN